MAKNPFRKIRALDDKTLEAALTNHADVLKAVASATNLLLRERRLLLMWAAVMTLGLLYVLVFSITPDFVWQLVEFYR